jgi:hypothetical protein
MLYDTFDRTGSAEYPFPKQVVFRALRAAVNRLAGMKVEGCDELACRLDIKTGISALSWGERVTVTVCANGDQAAVVSVQSGAKTVFGSATTHGKNRKNVREIINAISELLRSQGEIWRNEMGLVPQASSSKSSVADELTKLARLREQGILSDAEFQAQKARLLAS